MTISVVQSASSIGLHEHLATLHMCSSFFKKNISKVISHLLLCLVLNIWLQLSLVASLVGVLDDDSLKLYTLIWKRTMACQMEASRTDLVGYSCSSFFHMVDFVLYDGYKLYGKQSSIG